MQKTQARKFPIHQHARIRTFVSNRIWTRPQVRMAASLDDRGLMQPISRLYQVSWRQIFETRPEFDRSWYIELNSHSKPRTAGPNYVWRIVIPPSTGIVVPCKYDEAGRHTFTVTRKHVRKHITVSRNVLTYSEPLPLDQRIASWALFSSRMTPLVLEGSSQSCRSVDIVSRFPSSSPG